MNQLSIASKNTQREIHFPDDYLSIRPWPDFLIDSNGHNPSSPFVEKFWLPIIGPSTLLIMRKIADNFNHSPDGFTMEVAKWAMEIGLGAKGGRNGPLWRSIRRTSKFNLSQKNSHFLYVRRKFPPLSYQQSKRLPNHLHLDHRVWLERELDKDSTLIGKDRTYAVGVDMVSNKDE